MRARLFRERNPAAFGILTDPNPPVLAKVPATITERGGGAHREQGADGRPGGVPGGRRVGPRGQDRRSRRRVRAPAREYRDSWIDRVSGQRLASASGQRQAKARSPRSRRLAAKYPGGDRDIEKDPKVIFAENFEEPTLDGDAEALGEREPSRDHVVRRRRARRQRRQAVAPDDSRRRQGRRRAPLPAAAQGIRPASSPAST